MLKGVDKLNKFLTDWCRANGLNVTCKLGTDFQYEPFTNTIYYTFVIPEEHDKLYRKVCKPLIKNYYMLEPFILSLFHEIGHSETLKDFDMEDYKKGVNTATDYYKDPIEYAATKWACKYINDNEDQIVELFDTFIPMVNNFYKENNIEVN